MIYRKQYKNLSYLISLPENFDENKKYPTILSIHGAGGRGKDLGILEDSPILKTKNEFCFKNFVVILPQCYADTWFDIFEQLQDFAKAMSDLPYVEKSRYFVIGVSMGGYGTFQLVCSLHELFKKVTILCGGGMYWNAARVKNIPIKFIHGAKDETVLPRESQILYNRINAVGGKAELIIHDDLDHNVWDRTFADDETYKWLLRD